MQIENTKIGQEEPPYIIAEIGAGHHGFTDVVRMIEVAKEAGASAVKLQVYTPEEMTLNSTRKDFIVQAGEWKREVLWKLYSKARTPLEWLPELFAVAKQEEITLFSSVFGMKTLEVLEKLGCPAYKIASFESTHYELITEVMRTNKPMMISTGLTPDEDIEYLEYEVLFHRQNTAFLHCVSAYPCPVAEAELSRITTLCGSYGHFHQIGYSDHTPGHIASVGAFALGATIFEKHMAMPGSEDATFGVRLYEFADYVRAVRDIYTAVKLPRVMVDRADAASMQFRRSIYVTKSINQGEFFTPENIAVVRPGYGAHPTHYEAIIKSGYAKVNLEPNHPLIMADHVVIEE